MNLFSCFVEKKAYSRSKKEEEYAFFWFVHYTMNVILSFSEKKTMISHRQIYRFFFLNGVSLFSPLFENSHRRIYVFFKDFMFFWDFHFLKSLQSINGSFLKYLVDCADFRTFQFLHRYAPLFCSNFIGLQQKWKYQKMPKIHKFWWKTIGFGTCFGRKRTKFGCPKSLGEWCFGKFQGILQEFWYENNSSYIWRRLLIELPEGGWRNLACTFQYPKLR